VFGGAAHHEQASPARPLRIDQARDGNVERVGVGKQDTERGRRHRDRSLAPRLPAHLAFPAMSPWVRVIIIINIAVFIWSSQNPEQAGVLAFVPMRALQQPWTIVTYMFLHAGFGHILFNMLSLFFFGPQVEQRLGANRFLILYLAGGFTGALASALITPRVGLVGA
jgi:membrane associated rhomboid family serine protease